MVLGHDVGFGTVNQAAAQELLLLIRDIADPCEDIRAKAVALAGDASQSPEMQQALADLATTIEQLFGIGRYILREAPKD